MTMTYYPHGYGKREKPPECQSTPETIECTCCEGAQEHTFGHGMDEDGVTCSTCGGHGYLIVSKPKG